MAFQPSLTQLERWVSPQRLATYAADQADTVALYAWNADLSSALFEMIGHTEVLLRNVIHNQLAPHSPGDAWYDDSYYRFTPPAQSDIKRAKHRAGIGAPPGKVIAELSFGFWRYLLASTYQSTVWPRLAKGLTGVPGANGYGPISRPESFESMQ